MKKLIGLMVIVMAVFAVTGCGGGSADTSTPKGATENAIKCMQNEDYQGLVECMFDESVITDKEKEEMSMVVSMLETKLKESTKKTGGLKDYEILDETIDGDKAKVNVRMVYGNGKEEVEEMKLEKSPGGKWVLTM